MRIFLLLVHLFALAALLGSIFADFAIAAALDRQAGMETYAGALAAKAALTKPLVYGGVVLLLLSGVGLLLMRMAYVQQGWMIAKLALVLILAVSAVIVAAPIDGEMAEIAAKAAASGTPPPAELAALQARQEVLDALNLALILAIVFLSLRKRLWL
ncbi:DUF2269 family protein [Afifella pfennigii]|uniref:DUF2269 family protein n=1 Tax=Afifella pfennigii TaxID=209897 RepID=UPI00047EB805|nr:DUF2269 family protein [Afifella pfennigii]